MRLKAGDVPCLFRLKKRDVRGRETHLLFEARDFVLGRLVLCRVRGQMGARTFKIEIDDEKLEHLELGIETEMLKDERS